MVSELFPTLTSLISVQWTYCSLASRSNYSTYPARHIYFCEGALASSVGMSLTVTALEGALFGVLHEQSWDRTTVHVIYFSINENTIPAPAPHAPPPL